MNLVVWKKRKKNKKNLLPLGYYLTFISVERVISLV